MLDMGFHSRHQRILRCCQEAAEPLFSATFSDEIKDLADNCSMLPHDRGRAPQFDGRIITQTIHPVDRDRSAELLSHLIKSRTVPGAVFTRPSTARHKLAEQLNHDGITALAIHGNKSQGARTRALSSSRTRACRF